MEAGAIHIPQEEMLATRAASNLPASTEVTPPMRWRPPTPMPPSFDPPPTMAARRGAVPFFNEEVVVAPPPEALPSPTPTFLAPHRRLPSPTSVLPTPRRHAGAAAARRPGLRLAVRDAESSTNGGGRELPNGIGDRGLKNGFAGGAGGSGAPASSSSTTEEDFIFV